MVNVSWLGGLAFEVDPPSGYKFVLDGASEEKTGPSPLESLLASAAACSAIDVVMILEKMRQKVTSYRVEVEGVRSDSETYPRPYVSIGIKHFLKGENLDPVAVQRAVDLSDEKYCTVVATLRAGPTITSTWEIES